MDVINVLRVLLLLSFAVLGHCDGASDIELELNVLARRIDFVHLEILKHSLGLEGKIHALEAKFQSIEAELQGRYLSQDNVGRGGSSVKKDEVSQKLAPFYKAFEEEKRLRKIHSVDTKTNVDTLNATCKDFYDQTWTELMEVANNSTMTDVEITNDVQNLSDEMDSKFNQLERSVQNLQQSFSGLKENITHIHAGDETILQSIPPPVNYALGIPLEQLSGGYRTLERIVDGDNSSCSHSPYARNPQQLHINLGHPVIIARIVIIGYIFRYTRTTSINVTVTVSRMDSNSPQQVCGQSKIQHAYNKNTPFNIILLCEAPLIGSIVHVSLDHDVYNLYSRMCEVEVYSTT